MIRNLRYTTQKLEWELPAGRFEKGETILSSAYREFLEETGMEGESLREVYVYNPSNGMSIQTIHVIFGIAKLGKNFFLDSDEIHSVSWLSHEKIRELIANHEITDGISLTPILLYLSQ